MRICVVSRFETFGGVEVCIADWLRFISLNNMDLEVVVCLPEDREQIFLEALDSNIAKGVIITPFRRVPGPINRFYYFKGYFKKINPDVVVFVFACITDFDFLEVMLASLYSEKVIISFHTFVHYFLYPLYLWKFLFSKYKIGTLKDLITRKLMGLFAHTIYSCSRVLRDEVRSFFSYLPAERFKVLYHGVDTRRFKPVDNLAKIKFKERLGFNKDDVVFISTSRLARIKNVDKIIRAFHEVRSKNPDYNIKLLIVGIGEAEEELRELASTLGLEDSIMFVGLKYDVENFLGVADIFVMASEGDAFGIALIEAMACGLFCIAVNKGGPSEILDKTCGYLIDSVQDLSRAMKDAVVMLKERPLEFERVCRSAVERVKLAFDKDRNIRNFLKDLMEM